MAHYRIEQWTDFVRGLLESGTRAGMQRHLDECAECAREVRALGRVAEASRREVEVPEPVLAAALALFPPRRAPAESVWRTLVAALRFDSLGGLAPVGVRSLEAATRRLTFQVEDFELELLVGPGATPSQLAVTGQVSGAGSAPAPWPVTLRAGRKPLQETHANEFGEFHLEFVPRAGLTLAIRDEAGRREIEVPLASAIGLRQNPR